MTRLKVIALEEHFITAEIHRSWKQLAPAYRDKSVEIFLSTQVAGQLEELAEKRISLMDDSGVDIQVLSLTSPGVQNLEGSDALRLAQHANDIAAATIHCHPTRFEGFCALPTGDPTAAVGELRRAITELGLKGAMLFGRTRDRNLDHPDFYPILEAIAELGVPIYLHPQIPQNHICETYYSGFGEPLDTAFATLGWGWHMEAGIQAIRLILSGVFDRLPTLQVILGHWGEMVTFWLQRLDAVSPMAKRLKKSVAEYYKSNFYVTPGGILNASYLARSLEVLGPERLLFATDYPYQFAPNGGARRFIEEADLDQETKRLFACGNWQRLSLQAKKG